MLFFALTVLSALAYVTCFTASSAKSGLGHRVLFRMSDDSSETADDVWGTPVGPLPSVSSKYNFGEENLDGMVHDLWIVGAGTLGTLIADIWQETFPGVSIVTETKTETRHGHYAASGKEPRLRDNRSDEDTGSAKHVIIALPPSSSGGAGGTHGYAEEISKAALLWAGPNAGGTLTFTSSIGVYGDSLGNRVDEKFRLDTRSLKSSKLINAEEAVLRRGGSVIRLSGLYTETRGPHTYWLRKGAEGEMIDAAADGIINMLHYEDAAMATVSAALTQPKYTGGRFDSNNHMLLEGDGEVYVAVDDEPITREEICRSALASGLFPAAKMPTFSSDVGPVGKIVDSSATRDMIEWSPMRPSFRVFMRRLGGEEVEENDKSLIQVEKEKASTLWMPGDDDDDLF